jgi:hypothetical protein
LIEQKIEILKILKTEITQYHPEEITRYTERQAHKYFDIQTYIDTSDHKKKYLIKRIQDTLSDNNSFQTKEVINREKVIEELSPQLIKVSKEKLYHLLLQNIQKFEFPYPVPLPQAMKYVKLALFLPGYATTLKHLYPDETERKAIRQQYIQTITKELLLEIQQRLLSEQQFIAEEYHMWSALLYVYKQYGGQEEISLDLKSLQEKYYQYQKKAYQNILIPLREKFEEENADPYLLYKTLYKFADSISKQTFFFLNATPNHLPTKPRK